MKKATGNGSLFRAITAMLIVVILVLTVSIAVSGWQADSNGENSGEDGNITDNADNQNGDTDVNEGTADNNSNTAEKPLSPTAPEYTYYLSGLECDAALTATLPFAFVMESSAPMYGTTDTELLIEIPTEDGKTRYIVYKSDIDSIGKIGAISKTRDYISAVSKMFGGILIANGEDDIVNYPSLAATLHLDLSKRPEAIYKENGNNVYTDAALLYDYINDESIDRETFRRQSIPFSFASFGDTVKCKTSAKHVLIPYSDTGATELLYDPDIKEYYLMKGGRYKTDMLTGENASFRNALVLFADSITYEMAEGTESVIDVTGSGYGYYMTEGGMKEVKWSTDSSGILVIRTLSGEELVVNRGSTYISYFKASIADKVIFE